MTLMSAAGSLVMAFTDIWSLHIAGRLASGAAACC